MKLRDMLTFNKEPDTIDALGTIFQCFSGWATKRLLSYCVLLCRLQRHKCLLWIFHRPLRKCKYSPDNGTVLPISVFCENTKLNKYNPSSL